MAVTYIVNALGGTTTTTSFSITLPTTQAGDILILEFCHRGTGNGTIAGTYTGPAFTLKHSQLFASSAFSGKTYYSRATGNHSGETVTGSGLINSCAAILTVYRGALASGDPLADATIVGEENASGNETQAQITTATNGSWVVLVVVNSPDLAVATQACTSPGTLTERAERLSTGGTDSSIAHASAEKASAGGTGALTWTQTDAASGSWAYAIKPEPAPSNPTITAASIADADRDWDVPFQDIAITFSETVDITPAPSVGDTIAGLTAQVNGGANAALTYRSGNATASWKVRRAELIQQDDTVVLDYSQASGAILAVDDNAELSETVDAAVTNNLTKRVRFILKKSDNSVVASETVKYGIFQYDSGAPANANWMTRDTKGTVATTAAGLVDVQYTGSVAVGGTVYVVIVRPDTTPTESMVWTDAVV